MAVNKMWRLFLTSRELREFWQTYLKVILITVIVFHILITGVKSSHENINDKGAFCTENQDCDENRYLDCIESICACSKFKRMTWVPEYNMCMIMEDAPCDYESVCVPNSSCNSGKCECNDDFLRNGFGMCELRHGSKCSDSDGLTCASRYLLECSKGTDPNSSGKCQCQGEGIELVWDEIREKCVRTAGGKCDVKVNGQNDQLECIQNADCVYSGVCECKPGYTQAPDGTCLLEYGQKCNNSEEFSCNKFEFLVCRDDKCTCQFYGQMAYDDMAKQCRWLVGEDCDVINDHGAVGSDNDVAANFRICVRDAVCKQRSHSHRGTCVCIQGLEKSLDGTCTKYKGHGKPCSASMDCDKKQFLECIPDEEQGGRCECLHSQMYYNGKQCRVLPGKSCVENKLCAENSYCEGSWCVCEQGYRVGNPDCVKIGANSLQTNHQIEHQNVQTVGYPDPENQPQQRASLPAHREIDCVNLMYGTTEWKKCQCQIHSSSHGWSDEKTECLALVGSYCSKDSECTENAECDTVGQTCQCTPEAVTTSNRTCILKSAISKASHSHTNDVLNCTEHLHLLKAVRAQYSTHDSTFNGATSYIKLNSMYFAAEVRLLLKISLLTFIGQYCFM